MKNKDLIERLRKGRNHISGDDCDAIADALEASDRMIAAIKKHCYNALTLCPTDDDYDVGWTDALDDVLDRIAVLEAQ